MLRLIVLITGLLGVRAVAAGELTFISHGHSQYLLALLVGLLVMPLVRRLLDF